MPIWKQKLLSRLLRDDNPDDAGGGDGDHLQREQEIEAARQGWVPKHKFKGPEEQWKDAATFLQVGRETKSGMQKEINALKQQLQDFQGTAKQFAEFQQRQIEQRDAEIADLIKDLKRLERTAIRDGDDNQAEAIADRIELLNEERTNTKKQLSGAKQDGKPEFGPGSGNTDPRKGPVDPKVGIDEQGNTENPLLLEWISDGNQWMRDNPSMRAYAFETANEIITSGEQRRGRPFLDLLREKMEEAFPRYFGEGKGNPNDRGSIGASGGGRSGGGGGNYTEADLPEADREIMRMGIKQGWTTKEKFLKSYFSEAPRIHRTEAKSK